MSPKQWQRKLKQQLEQVGNGNAQAKIAVLGVGNELDADDSIGIQLARLLQQLSTDSPQQLILEGGTAPENQTGALRKFSPEYILIIDAADLRDRPGSIQLLKPEQAEGFSGSTHSLPLAMLARYLQDELDCAVSLMGIQPPLASEEIDQVGRELHSLFGFE